MWTKQFRTKTAFVNNLLPQFGIASYEMHIQDKMDNIFGFHFAWIHVITKHHYITDSFKSIPDEAFYYIIFILIQSNDAVKKY